MTTTMPGMKRVVEMLKGKFTWENKGNDRRGPVSQAYCDKIDAMLFPNAIVMPKVSFVKENISIEVKKTLYYWMPLERPI